MPVPLPMPLVVKNGSKIFSMTSWLIPVPVSSTSIKTYSPAAKPTMWLIFWLSRSEVFLVRIESLPPDGMASRAFLHRLRMTLSIWVLSALTYQRSRSDWNFNSIFSPVKVLSIGARSVVTSPRLRTEICCVCLRAKPSKLATKPAAR